ECGTEVRVLRRDTRDTRRVFRPEVRRVPRRLRADPARVDARDTRRRSRVVDGPDSTCVGRRALLPAGGADREVLVGASAVTLTVVAVEVAHRERASEAGAGG